MALCLCYEMTPLPAALFKHSQMRKPPGPVLPCSKNSIVPFACCWTVHVTEAKKWSIWSYTVTVYTFCAEAVWTKRSGSFRWIQQCTICKRSWAWASHSEDDDVLFCRTWQKLTWSTICDTLWKGVLCSSIFWCVTYLFKNWLKFV